MAPWQGLNVSKTMRRSRFSCESRAHYHVIRNYYWRAWAGQAFARACLPDCASTSCCRKLLGHLRRSGSIFSGASSLLSTGGRGLAGELEAERCRGLPPVVAGSNVRERPRGLLLTEAQLPGSSRLLVLPATVRPWSAAWAAATLEALLGSLSQAGSCRGSVLGSEGGAATLPLPLYV